MKNENCKSNRRRLIIQFTGRHPNNLKFSEPLAKPSEAVNFAKKERQVMPPESDRMKFVRTHSDRQRRAHHHVFLGRDAITILVEHTRKVVSVAGGGTRGTE